MSLELFFQENWSKLSFILFLCFMCYSFIYPKPMSGNWYAFVSTPRSSASPQDKMCQQVPSFEMWYMPWSFTLYIQHPKNRDHVLLSLLSLPLFPIFKSINNSRMCNNTPNIKLFWRQQKATQKREENTGIKFFPKKIY
jgi:hypothetical protein